MKSPAKCSCSSTVHQAKGLEWRHVFVPRLIEESFPHRRALDEPGGEDEERRIFYVAITRAMNELTLTYPVTIARRRARSDSPRDYPAAFSRRSIEALSSGPRRRSSWDSMTAERRRRHSVRRSRDGLQQELSCGRATRRMGHRFQFSGATWFLPWRCSEALSDRRAGLPRPRPFRIQVVEAGTGRGVPLVELKTVNQIRYYTDSNGIVAFDEPGLFNQRVYFSIRSHGYEADKDGLGYRGASFMITEGGSAQVVIHRQNIARRLYRVTGEGIYRDSLLTGDKVPIREPLLNGQVFGQDSVVNAVYQGKIYWFWGDTNRPDYPLGNFHVPGATSELPGRGGLEPEQGVDLDVLRR